MSINIAFYGSECFDLLHYVSRVLKACNISSIMIDWSADQSLYNSVPNPGIQENEVIWRVRFANGKGMNLCPRNEAEFSCDTAVPGHIAVSQEKNNEWMKKLENGEMISVI